jgi:hypothetical protein
MPIELDQSPAVSTVGMAPARSRLQADVGVVSGWPKVKLVAIAT